MTQPILPPADLAMLIDVVSRRSDPMTRFVESLSDDLRRYAEETIRMRNDLAAYTQKLLSCTDPHEAQGYATWIARHAHEVAYRWPMLVRSATRVAELEVERIQIIVRDPDHSGSDDTND